MIVGSMLYFVYPGGFVPDGGGAGDRPCAIAAGRLNIVKTADISAVAAYTLAW